MWVPTCFRGVWADLTRGMKACFSHTLMSRSRAMWLKKIAGWGLNPYRLGLFDVRNSYPLFRKVGEYLNSRRANPPINVGHSIATIVCHARTSTLLWKGGPKLYRHHLSLIVCVQKKMDDIQQEHLEEKESLEKRLEELKVDAETARKEQRESETKLRVELEEKYNKKLQVCEWLGLSFPSDCIVLLCSLYGNHVNLTTEILFSFGFWPFTKPKRLLFGRC